METERIMTEQEARMLDELERRKARAAAIKARLVAPLDKMKRQIARKIKQLEAARLN